MAFQEPCPAEQTADKCEWQSHDRRKDHMEWCKDVDRRLDDGAKTMKGLHEAIAENTTATNNIKTDTSELIALLNSFKGAFKVLEIVGKLAKPIAAIAGAGVALWALFSGKGHP